jgi:Cu/Ag efflux protein CusF
MRCTPTSLPVLLVLGLAALPACEKAPAPASPAARYTVRGSVAFLPDGEASKKLELKHEAIPSFKNRKGETTGMVAMQMPFGLAPGVSLAGIVVGDPVEFTFETRWDAEPSLVITALAELPAQTPLVLEK